MKRPQPAEFAAPPACAAVRPLRAQCPIVLACDEGYAMPLATTLRSAAEHNRSLWPLDVTVLHDGFSASARDKVERSLPVGAAAIRWVALDMSGFDGFGLLGHVSRMTYARLQIPALFAETGGKVLYLDTDILVLDDLSALMRADLDGAAIGAVHDFHVDANLKEGLVSRTVGVPRVRQYFNAGILLLDIDACLRRQVMERAIRHLQAHPATPYADQDALNVACDGDWAPLAGRWNFQDHHMTPMARLPDMQRPAIVHFITSSKPWKPRSGSVNAAFYDSFRARTRFARPPLRRLGDWAENCGWRIRRRLARLAESLTPPPGSSARADPAGRG
jgi:lipopolysaccharide biosynthesis glycosyltransferase